MASLNWRGTLRVFAATVAMERSGQALAVERLTKAALQSFQRVVPALTASRQPV